MFCQVFCRLQTWICGCQIRFFPALQWKWMLCHGTTNSRACGRLPQKNAVEAEYPLFPCTPLECVGDFLYPTTELSYSQSIFCPLPLSSSTRRMHRELNIYKDSLCSIRSSRGTRQEALRQEKVAFLGKLSQKCPVWRVLRRNSPVLFFFPGAPSVLVGGSLGF